MQHDDEPVFKRSKWGTNRYYYNPRNPVGLALIVITLLIGGTMMPRTRARSEPGSSERGSPVTRTRPPGGTLPRA
ncbi:hypothetical protein, partial [Streptomyces sp. NPDC041003]|uniref:hypothetical protein n=1 Tax=Streptomyces sp. NPDC041003 TaxID=3155730 RepID=UPI0033D7A725